MNDHMVVLTSLSPKENCRDRQQAALESWRAAGFHAVSLNPEAETGIIRKTYGSSAEVLAVDRLCSHGAGRQLVAVTDLIERSFEKNLHAAFLLNADIQLAREATGILGSFREGVTMIPRWEIDRTGELENCEMNPWGYDGVLLGPEMRGVFLCRAFGLGLPWWDYWIPFRALHLGYPVRVLQQPVAFHVRHAEQWNERDRARLAGKVWHEVGVPPWKRFWRKHLGPKKDRKFYGYHNHLAGHVRAIIREKAVFSGFHDGKAERPC